MMAKADHTILTLPPIAVDLEQLRGIERLLRSAGPCRVRRFDEVFESLDALIVAYPLPLRHLTFDSPGLKVLVSRDGVSVTHDGDALERVREIETHLRDLAVPPVLRWLIALRVILATALFVAIYESEYATLLMALVVMVLLEHTAFEARARSSALKLRADWTLDPRLGVAMVGLVILFAKLVQRIF